VKVFSVVLSIVFESSMNCHLDLCIVSDIYSFSVLFALVVKKRWMHHSMFVMVDSIGFLVFYSSFCFGDNQSCLQYTQEYFLLKIVLFVRKERETHGS
jgi:hypothetical protein